MKNVAKISVGTIVLLYAVFGYLTGEIYRLPGRRDFGELVSGDGLVYCVSSYIAFAFVFYASSLPNKTKYKVTKRIILRRPKEVSMVILLFLGFTMQGLCVLVE